MDSDTRIAGITPGGLNHPASTSSSGGSGSVTGSGSAEISGYLSSVLSVEQSGSVAGGMYCFSICKGVEKGKGLIMVE